MKTVCIVAIVAFMCVVGNRAAAQETTGTISGRIVDAQGLVLPGVAVTATGAQGVKTTATDDYNAFSELRFNVSNPDFGLAGVSDVVAGRQLAPPRQFRVGVR